MPRAMPQPNKLRKALVIERIYRGQNLNIACSLLLMLHTRSKKMMYAVIADWAINVTMTLSRRLEKEGHLPYRSRVEICVGDVLHLAEMRLRRPLCAHNKQRAINAQGEVSARIATATAT